MFDSNDARGNHAVDVKEDLRIMKINNSTKRIHDRVKCNEVVEMAADFKR